METRVSDCRPPASGSNDEGLSPSAATTGPSAPSCLSRVAGKRAVEPDDTSPRVAPSISSRIERPCCTSQAETRGPSTRVVYPVSSTPCQGKVEMSYSQQSRNVLFEEVGWRGGVRVDSMFRGSRAPWGRSEDRCDGAGSEADGAKPPVKPGHKLPVLGVLVFLNKICFGEASEQRSSDT
jgi:hypothetical protein